MPETDLGFAELPAEVDIPTLVPADEIDQTDLRVLQFCTDALQFLGQADQTLAGAVKNLLYFGTLLRIWLEFLDFRLLIDELLMNLDHISNDPAYQRKRAVGLLHSEATLRP